jgi:ATP/maltotriose-dependent transcriptional regulator MalT
MAHWLGSRATPAAEEARETMAHAAAAGDEGLRSLALSMYIATLMYGRANAEEMTLELDRIEREGVPGAWTQAFVAVARAQAALLEGLFEDGMRHAREAGDGFAALRSGFEAFAYQLAADIERTQGNPEAALSRLERADVILERSHERSFRSTNQANIAVVHAALGEADKARAAIDTCEELSAPEDVINYAFTHRVRSQLARTTGDLEQAEQSARSAVEYALTSDFPGVQANARLELARVLVAQGRREECEIEAREALALRESKGDRPGAAEVRALLDELASPV